jgi:hypothetical protein
MPKSGIKKDLRQALRNMILPKSFGLRYIKLPENQSLIILSLFQDLIPKPRWVWYINRLPKIFFGFRFF